MANAALQIFFFECTSFNVGRHVDMLVEPRHLKGCAQGVGLDGRDVEVADNQSVLVRFDEILQYVCRFRERFVS